MILMEIQTSSAGGPGLKLWVEPMNAQVGPIYSQVMHLSESQERSVSVIFSVDLVWQCGPANVEVGRKLQQMGEIRGRHFFSLDS